MAHSKVHALTQGASMLARFSLTLYTAFLQKSLFRFFITVILSVLGRVFNLLAFIISIQAIYIAFQSSASDGATFKGKQYFDMLGLSDVWVPWLLALLVVGVTNQCEPCNPIRVPSTEVHRSPVTQVRAR